MSKNKRAPDEALDPLERIAIHEEAERVAKLSDEELDSELAGKGFDPTALRVRGAALAARLAEQQRAATRARTAPKTTSAARRWVVTLAAASVGAAAAAAAATAVVQLAARVGIGSTQVASPPPAQDDAPALRREAQRACDDGRWVECGARLDEAKAIDPKGEETPAVKALRRAIAEGSGRPPN